MTVFQDLTKLIVNVATALSELQVFVYEDGKCRELFEEAINTGLALPMSLDEFIAEWNQLVIEVSSNKESLYQSWKSSVTTKRDCKLPDKANWFENLNDNDLVFENGSYINVHMDINKGQPYHAYYVEINRDCKKFTYFDDACEYLWHNHAKESYGV